MSLTRFGHLVWNSVLLRDSVTSARVNPALDGCLEQSGRGKQEECAKVQDGSKRAKINMSRADNTHAFSRPEYNSYFTENKIHLRYTLCFV